MNTDPANPDAPHSTSAEDDDRDAELARLRERLAFYQSFDGLIQDNIARSGDLLRQAMEMRESASREIAAAQADAALRRTEERSRYRILFSAMLDELTALQGQAERLARRLSDALDDIETDLPSGTAAVSLAELDLGDDDLLAQTLALDAGTQPFATVETAVSDDREPGRAEPEPDAPLEAALTAEAADEIVSGLLDFAEELAAEDSIVPETPETSGEPLRQFGATEPLAPPHEPELLAEEDDIPLDIRPFAPEEIDETRHFAGGNDLALQPAVDPDTATPPAPQTGLNATVVLVHGVPRATTALSLKRYLESLAHVGAVEPREFAEGILRLEVSAARPLAFDDLRSWPEGAGLEPVHLRDDLVEVRLSP